MFNLILLFVSLIPPLVPDGLGVSVADADRFRPASAVSEWQWKLAAEQRKQMLAAVWFSNDRETVSLWAHESAWRIACWEKLNAAFNPETVRWKAWSSYPEFDRQPFEAEKLRERLKMIGELRALLGPGDFYAGRMPFPVPNYKP